MACSDGAREGRNLHIIDLSFGKHDHALHGALIVEHQHGHAAFHTNAIFQSSRRRGADGAACESAIIVEHAVQHAWFVEDLPGRGAWEARGATTAASSRGRPECACYVDMPRHAAVRLFSRGFNQGSSEGLARTVFQLLEPVNSGGRHRQVGAIPEEAPARRPAPPSRAQANSGMT
jgi:hypothetical protein